MLGNVFLKKLGNRLRFLMSSLLLLREDPSEWEVPGQQLGSDKVKKKKRKKKDCPCLPKG